MIKHNGKEVIQSDPTEGGYRHGDAADLRRALDKWERRNGLTPRPLNPNQVRKPKAESEVQR